MSGVLRRAALLAAGSTIVGLYFASQAAFNPAIPTLASWRKALLINLTYYYCWGLAVPAILTLTRRWPLSIGGWRRARVLLLHVAASFAIGIAVTVAAEVVLNVVLHLRPESLAGMIRYGLATNFHSILPTYWMVVLAGTALDAYVRLRDREVQASRLEARLSEARLDALRMQVRPHFLFNTLNSIATLVYVDPPAADRMLSRLAGFLRATLDFDSRATVPVSRELDFVQRYLEIERIRFGERLHVSYDVDAAVADALVPPFILQPLVENAVHHAIAARTSGGRITIAARAAAGETILLGVVDDGPGVQREAGETGVGLHNTETRLRELYGGRASLTLAAAQPGVRVQIRLPLEIASVQQVSVACRTA